MGENHNSHRVHSRQEQNHMDRTSRSTGTTEGGGGGGGGESPTQHEAERSQHNRTTTTTGSTVERGDQTRGGWWGE